jgi:uncharacterized protein (DUF488 family)
MNESGKVLYTIGHSNHPLEHFLDLLQQYQIELLVDVRSYPSARYVPHFNAENLRKSLEKRGVSYVTMGYELGGRPNAQEFYDENGYVRYDKLSQAPFFLGGMNALRLLIQKYRVSIMCTEEDPNQCHRRLLISRILARDGFDIEHIRGGGNLDPETLLSEQDPIQEIVLSRDGISNSWRSPRPIR